MPNAITNAVTSHFAGLFATGGASVTYARGGDSVVIEAVPFVVEHETIGDDGSTISFQTRDYMVRAADLVLDSVEELPQRFDTITEAGEAYEVKSPGGGREYAYADPGKTLLTIHTIDKHAGD